MTFSINPSALDAAANRLSVIGNNITNSGVNGYQASDFSDVLSSQGASSGAKVSGTRQLFTQGQIQTSSNTMDMAISGKGFYRVERSDGSFGYTRSGSYSLDKNGYMVDPAGDFLTGYLPDAAGTGISVGLLQNLKVDTRNSVPKVTTAATQNVLLDSRQSSIASASLLTPAGLVYQKTMQMWNVASNSVTGDSPTISDIVAGATNELKLLTNTQSTTLSIGQGELADALDNISRLRDYYANANLIPTGATAKAAAFTKDLNAILAKTLDVNHDNETFEGGTVQLEGYALIGGGNFTHGAIEFDQLDGEGNHSPVTIHGKFITSTAASGGAPAFSTFHFAPSTSYSDTIKYNYQASDAVASLFSTESRGQYNQLFPANLSFPSLTGSIAVQSANAANDQGVSFTTASTNAKAFSIGDSSTYTSTTLSTIYDKQGMDHTLQTYYVKRSADQWDVYSAIDGVGTNMNIDNTSIPNVKYYYPNFTVNFDQTGNLQSVGTWTQATGANVAIDQAFVPPGADAYDQVDPRTTAVRFPLSYLDSSNTMQEFSLDITKTQQYATDFLAATQQDGFPTGQFQNVTVNKDGKLYAHYSSGAANIVGQVVLATFPSETNLSADRNNQFIETSQSGAPRFNTPGTGGSGQILGSSVETSSVDLTSEMIKLIAAQRAYQANSEVIKRQDQVQQTVIGIGQ